MALRGASVAAFDHVDGRFELGRSQLAHAHDFGGEAREFGVVALDGVFVTHNGFLDYPNLPVM